MPEDDRMEEVPASLGVHAYTQGHWGVAQKLWLCFGLLLTIMVVSSVVSYYYIMHIERDLRQIVEIEEPLEQAVLEMEINAGETARAVLDYVRDLEPEHIELMHDSEADFERFARQFERLAETDEERRLGRMVAGLYSEFKLLGDQIIALADQQSAGLAAFENATEAADALIDGELKPLASLSTQGRVGKTRAADDLDDIVNALFPQVEAYVIHRDPAIRETLYGADDEFDRLAARYKAYDVSAKEVDLLERIRQELSGAIETGLAIMAIVDRLHRSLEDLEQHLIAMDSALDDEIQPLIHAETVKASDHSQASTELAGIALLVLGVIALIFGSSAAWITSKTIMVPVRALVAGVDAVAGGDLDQAIDIKSKDELGHLATAFNRMVAILGRAMRSIEDGRENLERKIEERKRAEVALIESEARLVDAIESFPEGFVLYDADERFVLCNDRYRGLYPSIADMLKPGARREDLARTAYEAGAIRGSAENTDARIERRLARYRTAQGSYEQQLKDGRWLLCSERHTSTGGIVGIQTDITERKREEERFHRFFELPLVGSAMYTPDKRWIAVNNHFCSMLGYTREELLDRTWVDVTDPEDVEKNLAMFDEAIAGARDLYTIDKRFVRKDGGIVNCNISVQCVRHPDGTPDYFIVLVVDITERKRAEVKIKAALEEKEVLLKEIHHRVKNNLQVISSMLSLQERIETDPRSVEVLKDNQRRIKVMARIHETLHQSEDLTSINTRDYLSTVVEDIMASSKIGEQAISSRLDVEDIVFDTDHAVACGQIVSEAVSNSLKHAFPDGRPGNIEVSLHRRGGERIELSVADDGRGLPEDFDHEQAETLGMRLINALAMQLSGVVNVNGFGGTRVSITFPENPS